MPNEITEKDIIDNMRKSVNYLNKNGYRDTYFFKMPFLDYRLTKVKEYFSKEIKEKKFQTLKQVVSFISHAYEQVKQLRVRLSTKKGYHVIRKNQARRYGGGFYKIYINEVTFAIKAGEFESNLLRILNNILTEYKKFHEKDEDLLSNLKSLIDKIRKDYEQTEEITLIDPKVKEKIVHQGIFYSSYTIFYGAKPVGVAPTSPVEVDSPPLVGVGKRHRVM